MRCGDTVSADNPSEASEGDGRCQVPAASPLRTGNISEYISMLTFMHDTRVHYFRYSKKAVKYVFPELSLFLFLFEFPVVFLTYEQTYEPSLLPQ